jgi:hypothetical protein
MWSISESSVVSPLIGPTLRDSTNHGTSCFCVLETLPFSLPADIFYSTPTLLTSEVTRSCSCGLSLTIGHILMRFGRMDSRMPRKLWSQLQQDLTYSWHPLPFGCITRRGAVTPQGSMKDMPQSLPHQCVRRGMLFLSPLNQPVITTKGYQF